MRLPTHSIAVLAASLHAARSIDWRIRCTSPMQNGGAMSIEKIMQHQIKTRRTGRLGAFGLFTIMAIVLAALVTAI